MVRTWFPLDSDSSALRLVCLRLKIFQLLEDVVLLVMLGLIVYVPLSFLYDGESTVIKASPLSGAAWLLVASGLQAMFLYFHERLYASLGKGSLRRWRENIRDFSEVDQQELLSIPKLAGPSSFYGRAGKTVLVMLIWIGFLSGAIFSILALLGS